MDIIFEYHNVEGSKRLEEFATEKLHKLKEKFDMIMRADVFFKTENTSSVKTGMICNIRVSVPGPRIFSESSNDDFITSISESIKEIDKQLTTKKGKMTKY